MFAPQRRRRGVPAERQAREGARDTRVDEHESKVLVRNLIDPLEHGETQCLLAGQPSAANGGEVLPDEVRVHAGGDVGELIEEP